MDPASVALYMPARLRGSKRGLLETVGRRCGAVAQTPDALAASVARGLVPCIGCYPEIRPLLDRWIADGVSFLYRDRGYLRRARRAAHRLAPGPGEGYWRWHRDGFQLAAGALDGPPAAPRRRAALGIRPAPWRKAGDHILVAAPSEAYVRFHGLAEWLPRTLAGLRAATGRPIRVRRKPRPREAAAALADELAGCHALVTHGSIAAVEAVLLGVPVFVDPVSAAAPVGNTDLAAIETPAMPDRDRWLAALAASQWNAAEMAAGLHWAAL